MLVVEDILKEPVSFDAVVMTIGSFDGVHLGHQAILQQVLEEARQQASPAAVLTFRPHPRLFFLPNHAPNLLTSDNQKIRLFGQTGVDAVFFLPFDAQVANMEPESFVENVLLKNCHLSTLIVGHDFRFGKGARGDYELLKRLAKRYGFRVSQMEPLLLQGERISSTAIRERILEGDLEQAERFLGRKYSLAGVVAPGRGIGRTLGFPTANVLAPRSVIPPHGVYAAEALVDNEIYPCAVNIGIAPTIRQEDVVVEAHLLDFTGDLTGLEIELVFHYRLRPEKKFPSRDALSAQIRTDVDTIRAYFINRTDKNNIRTGTG